MKKGHKELTLTGDDLALACDGLSRMIRDLKKGPRCSFRDRRINDASRLIKKIDAISDVAYPYPYVDLMPDDIGSEPIMCVDSEQISRTRNEAARRLSGYRGGAS